MISGAGDAFKASVKQEAPQRRMGTRLATWSRKAPGGGGDAGATRGGGAAILRARSGRYRLQGQGWHRPACLTNTRKSTLSKPGSVALKRVRVPGQHQGSHRTWSIYLASLECGKLRSIQGHSSSGLTFLCLGLLGCKTIHPTVIEPLRWRHWVVPDLLKLAFSWD